MTRNIRQIRIFRKTYEKMEHRIPYTYDELEKEVNEFLKDFADNEIYDIINMVGETGIIVVYQAVVE